MESDLGKCCNCKDRPGRICCPKCHFALYCDWDCQQQDQYRHETECINAIKVQKCHSCGCHSEKLKCCTGCYSAFYCGRKCQSTHFQDHKKTCLETGKAILQMAAARHRMPAFCGLPWYVGASLAEDYLRLIQNEGTGTDKYLRLLFIAVGDIRDVACTIARLPDNFNGKLEFVINDVSAHVMARNLLFLYCAIVHQNSANLVQIWYSVNLTDECLSFLVKILKELVTQSKLSILTRMHKLVTVSEEHWQLCVGIWEAWIQLSADVKAGQRFKEERKLKMESLAVNMLLMTEFRPREHVLSFKDFMKDGILLPFGSNLRQKAVGVNPTMAYFNPFNAECAFKYSDVNSIYPYRRKWGHSFQHNTEMIYGVREDCYAFVCWDYQVVKKTVGLKVDLVEMYQIYLEQLFNTIFRKLNMRKIRFHVIIDDFQKLDETLLKDKQFDRICTSNLSDYVPIPRLLKQFSPFLNRANPCAVLISHHQNWSLFARMPQMNKLAPEVIHRAVADSIARPDVLPDQQTIMESVFAFAMYVSKSGYVDVYPYFLQSYVAEVILYLHDYENVPLAKSAIAKVAKVPGKFGVRLRDYRTELNHVIPFYREGLSRRLEVNVCGKRCLEWVPV